MPTADIIASYQQLGVGGILIIVVLMVGRHLLKQNKVCYESHQQHVIMHKEEIKDMNINLLKVMQENARANTALAKAIEHLEVTVRGLKKPI